MRTLSSESSSAQPSPTRAAGTADDPVLAAGIVLWTGTAAEPQFLLLRNAKHQSWGLAKGHAEAGEELLQTALREVEEETALLLRADQLDDLFADSAVYQPKPGKWKRVMHYLSTQPVDPAHFQRSDEHDQHAWLSIDEAMAQPTHQALRRTLRRAHTRLAQIASA